ncbi:hypothetical protein F5148DRAFT_1148772 [Russula earlei]|uniref:Uncharacterized protein n=1 Tax=Russula earlei TaxID=71964 RepID=A0ACC0UCE4_9AGAM|nr:hypothetical protein F5148DRAFT_1148772 [Russula earlei]
MAFEIPANFWLALLTFTWGVTSVAQGLVANQAGLLVIRIPSGVSLVRLFTDDLCLDRSAIGILAYAIGKMGGVGGKRGWQCPDMATDNQMGTKDYIFTKIVSLTHLQLTDAERSQLLARLESDSNAAENENFAWKYGYALLLHGFSFVLYTLSLFLHSQDDCATERGGVPRYRVWCMVGLVAVHLLSSVWPSWLFLISSATPPFFVQVPSFAGCAILLATKDSSCYFSIPISLVAGRRRTKRAVGVAMQITIGDLGAVTGYITFSILVAAALWYSMESENLRRASIIAAGREEKVDHETKVLLGDREIH